MMSREWYEPECCEGTQPMKTRVWEKYYFLTYDNPDAHGGLAWMNPEGEKGKKERKKETVINLSTKSLAKCDVQSLLKTISFFITKWASCYRRLL
jgi:hypothetical protein